MKRLVTAISLLAIIFSSGCTTTSKKSAAKATDNNAEGLALAAREFTQTLLDLDGDAFYDWLTAECQDQLPREDFIESFEADGEGFLGVDADLDKVKVDSVKTRKVTKKKGEALIELTIEGGSQEEIDELNADNSYATFLYEGGEWKIDLCGAEESDDESADDEESKESDGADTETAAKSALKTAHTNAKAIYTDYEAYGDTLVDDLAEAEPSLTFVDGATEPASYDEVSVYTDGVDTVVLTTQDEHGICWGLYDDYGTVTYASGAWVSAGGGDCLAEDALDLTFWEDSW